MRYTHTYIKKKNTFCAQKNANNKNIMSQLSESFQEKLMADITYANNQLEEELVAKLTGSSKRERDDSSNPESKAKTPKLARYERDIIHEMEVRFERQWTMFKEALKETEERLNASMNKRFEEVELKLLNYVDTHIQRIEAKSNEINERLLKAETECAEIVSMREDIKNLRAHLAKQENLAVSCDLRVNGIPCYPSENLDHIFDCICKALNVATPPYKSIYRLKGKRGNNSPDTTIIVQLLTPFVKNYILKMLAQFRKKFNGQLCLHHIGFDSNQCVYINENLTSTNFKILQTGIKLKRQKKITSIYSFRGLIYAKTAPNTEPIHIANEVDFDQFFRHAIDTV